MNKVLTGLVAAVVLITAAAYNLIYTTAADGDKTGSCGENATWSFDETTGVLTISGTGNMYSETTNTCGLHNYDSNKCTSRRIPEKDIYEAYITMVNKLRNIYKEILPAAISQIERLQMKAGGAAARIKEIDREISDLNSKNLIIARLNSKGILRAAEYAEQSGKINSRVNELRSERIKLLKEQDENNTLSGLRKLNEVISNIENPLTEFDEQLFKSMVNKITVPTHTSICFELLSGLKITESIPEQRRCVKK